MRKYPIPEHSKDAWKRAIERDLGSKGSYDTLITKINEGISYEPVYHPDDQVDPYGPICWKTSNTWEPIASADQVPTSDEVDQMLNMGMKAVSISHADGISSHSAQFASWGHSLRLYLDFDKLHKACEVEDRTGVAAIFLSQQSLAGRAKLLDWNSTRTHPTSIITIAGEGQTEFASDLIWIIQELVKWFDVIDPIHIKSGVVIKFGTSTDFLANIARIRALKILLHHLWDLYGLTPAELPNIVVVASDGRNHGPEQALISLMVQASSAVIAGVDGLIIKPPGTDSGRSKWARTVMSIHHLLDMESHLDRVLDPLAGSYFVEHFTGSIVKYVWSQFRRTSL